MKKIAIIGSPGSGKTTLCNGLFYFLKVFQEHVEIVPELIKHKVYADAKFDLDGFDIVNTMEQKKFEEIFDSPVAKRQIEYLICEAPLCNGFFYASFYNKELEVPVLKKIAKDNINNYDMILFVQRLENDEFVSFGRKENLNKARELERHIHKQIIDLDYKQKIEFVNQNSNIFEIMMKIGVDQEKLEQFQKSNPALFNFLENKEKKES